MENTVNMALSAGVIDQGAYAKGETEIKYEDVAAIIQGLLAYIFQLTMF